MDIRLYYYGGYGILTKVARKLHKSKSVDEAEGKIKELWNKGILLGAQFVIVDYTGTIKVNSHIVKIINPGHYDKKK